MIIQKTKGEAMGHFKEPARLLYVLGQHSEFALSALQSLLKDASVEVSWDGRIASQRVESHCTLLFLDEGGDLSSKAERLATTGFKKKVILNLENLSLVRISSEVPHDLFWLSPTDPAQRLGVLVDSFQGAYFRNEELIVSLGTEFSIFSAPEVNNLTSSFKSIALAGALCAKLHGLRDEEVQQGLQGLLKTLTKPEWKLFSENTIKEAL